MKKHFNRLLALTLAVLLAVSVLPLTAAAEAETIASWTIADNAITKGGKFEASISELTCDIETTQYSGGGSRFGGNGWAKDKGFYFATPTTGCTALTVSGKVYASKTGPASVQLQGKVGGDWTNLGESIAIGNTDGGATKDFSVAVSEAKLLDQSKAEFRLVVDTETAGNGKAIAATGTLYLQDGITVTNGEGSTTPDPDPDPEPTGAYKPAAGDEVVIFYNSSDTAGKIMTGTPTGNNNDRLAGVDATVSEGKLTTKGEPLYLTVGVENDQYTFSNNGKYLTSGATGSSLTLEASPEGDLAKWTLEAHEDHWHIYNAEAAYNGNKNQAIEYYNAFYPYGYQDKYESSYVMTFYKKADVTVDKDEPEPDPPASGTTWTKVELADIKDTDTVTVTMTKDDVVYVLPNVGDGSKGQPLAVVAKASGDTLTTDEAEKYSWNMVKTDNGYYIKTGEQYLYTIDNNNGMRIGDTQGVWSLDGNYLKSSDGTNERWLGIQGTADWRAYKNTTPIANQTVGFWKLGEGGTTPTPSGEIKDGTYVIWNPTYNKALSSIYSSNYNTGVDVTEEGGKLTGYADTEIWNIKKEADGSYSISTADGNKLSMDEQYTSMPLDKANDKWEIQLQDDGTYYIYNIGRKAYIEWYTQKNNWSCYYSIAEGQESLFKQKLTPATPSGGSTKPGTPDTPADSGHLPVNGEKVAVYNPGNGLVMTDDLSGTRLKGATATVSGGKLFTDGTQVMLTVSVTGEGDNAVYTFTDSQGNLLNTGNEGGNLTLKAEAEAEAYQWKLTKADGGYVITSTEAKKNDRIQSIEVYGGNFTTYGLTTENDPAFTMQFYTEAMLGKDMPTDTDIVDTIAQWGGGGDYSKFEDHRIPGDVFKPNDMLDPYARFMAVVNGKAIDPVPTGNSPYMGGKGIGSGNNDYMEFDFVTMGYGDMTMSFRLRFTKSSPEYFQLQYSADGGAHYTNFEKGSYTYSYTDYSGGTQTPVTSSGDITDGIAKAYRDSQYIEYTFDLPVGAENADMLYVRLVPSEKSVSGGNITDANNMRIDSVVVKGSPIVDESVASFVTVEPDGVEEDVPAGTELTMHTADGGTINYRFVKLDGSNYNVDNPWYVYDENAKPKLPAELPIALEVMNNNKAGLQSVHRFYIYQAGTVEAVKMNPNGGGIVFTGDSTTATIELSCATAGAKIWYRTSAMSKDSDGDGNVDFVEYDAPITVEKGFKTLTVEAYAAKEGLANSAVTSRTFTEREKEKYDLYFGQMHSHTGVSDGTETPAAAYAHADGLEEAWNMDFLSVTDHSNSIDGAGGTKTINDSREDSNEWVESKAAAAAATNETFVGIYGYEMTWSNGLGHINTFNTTGFQDRTQSAYTTYSTALQNYYAELKTAPASISQFNHPGTTFGDFSDFAHYDPEIDELITLIEVGNGEGAIGSSGYFPSYEYYTRALDKGWHVAPTNNQDNHKGHWGDANTGRDVVLVDELTEEAIYDAMRNYRVYATEDLNLEIYYTFDGQLMGTQLTKDDVSDTAEIKVELHDPDTADQRTAKVEVIVNGGAVAASTTSTLNETVTLTVPTTYNYYYIKVTEADGDIAVTAPVWVGAVEAVGVSSFTAQNALTVVGEEQTFDLSLYNNEKKTLEVSSIVVTDKATGETIANVQGITQVKKLGTAEASFTHTFDTDGIYTLTATVKGTLDGVEKTYTQDLEVTVMPAALVTNIIVDGTHYNDYVTGYYGGNMGNMTTIAANNAVQVTVVGTGKEITKEMLNNCSLLVLSAPAKQTGTANAGEYVPSLWEDEFIAMVKEYVENGGSVVITGLADYQDKNATDAKYHTSAQQNKLLAAIGSTMKINDDEICDDVHNGGQNYRLYPETFNTESEWVKGIVDGQVYSQYSGCSVDIGTGGTWLVKGWDDSTYSIDSDGDKLGGIEKGSGDPVYFMGYEKVGEGNVFVSGGVFLSDFEVKAELDNIWDLPYANRTIYENILSSLCLTDEVTDISDTRKAELGRLFVIEGYVTNGTEYEPTTFFDAIYVQDETGGTTCFPYANAGLKIGTKVRILGYTDAYQDDREIQIISLNVLDDEPNVYPARVLTTKDAMNYATYGGQYLETTGTVSDLIMEGDKVSQFKLTDYTGVKATIFIDGYIWNKEGKDNVSADIKEGMVVTAAGMSYMHPEGEGDSVCVLRVRDMDDIKLNTTLPKDPNPSNPDPVDPTPSTPSTPTTPTTPEKPYRFEDVPEGIWYEDAVYELYEREIIEGIGDDLYAPETSIDRASIATIIYRLAGKPASVGGMDFEDVTGDDWYEDAVNWVSEAGYMTGYGNGTFGARDTITRQDMIVTLYRYAAQNGYDMSVEGFVMPDYTDIGDVAVYARDAMIWAVKAGISNGVGGGRLAPTSTASRAEVATLIYRMIALREGK